jgi:1-aminocyclopropane-1-carboxylate deaminase/D-cysteine desulfhydrase-like pyridoxal-dependent ACC family enzyme
MTDASSIRLEDWPVIRLGRWPTPLTVIRHPNLGNVMVKRDDLCGFGPDGRSGVKARKLESFLGYVNYKGYDTLIMPLGNVTNLGLDLSAALNELGIDLNLLIVDDPPLPRQIRVSLFRSMPSEPWFLGSTYVQALAALGCSYLKASIAGKRPLATLPSPAHPAAVAGVARGYFEMARLIEEMGAPLPRAIYIASAAGVSAAGFVLGELLMRQAGAPAVRIVAVQVASTPLGICLPWLLRWSIRFLALDLKPDLSNLSILKIERHTRYGGFDSGHENVCKRVAGDHDIALDPFYGGKSWSAMEQCEAGQGSVEDHPVLFWHCGYTPGWQTYADHVRRGASVG